MGGKEEGRMEGWEHVHERLRADSGVRVTEPEPGHHQAHGAINRVSAASQAERTLIH